MHETVRIEMIKCERCVAKIADALAPLNGVREARVQLGTSSVILDYEDSWWPQIESALDAAGFVVTDRSPVEPTTA
jgi:copper chaperone CopZ